MISMKAILLTILLLSFSSIVEGSDWLFIIGDDYSKFFIDVESVKRLENNRVTAWAKMVHAEPELYDDIGFVSYVVVYEEHDCKKEKTRFHERIGYNVAGQVLVSETDKTAWNHPPPDSPIIHKHHFLCVTP